MNFVFFFCDQMRAESVSCYGHPGVRMPNFDRLAGEGVTFEQCHIQSPLCSPSRCSLMTGWYPHVMGHRTLWHLLRSNEPSLFRYLKEAGYETVMYGKNDVFSEDYLSLALTADHYGSSEGKNAGECPYDTDDRRYYSFLVEPFEGDLHETADMKCVQKGIDFLKSRKKGDKPFMLFLPLLNPHPPYGPPQPYYDMYNHEDVPTLRPVCEQHMSDSVKLMRKYRKLDTLTEDELRKIHAVYLGMNSYADWMLGQLLDSIDRLDIKDETTVIVSSDHGDFAGDYGLVEKIHNTLYDVMTRVPLIIRSPGCAQGTRIAEQNELLDIMPTVLELANIEARHTHFGRSLAPQLSGACGDADRAVFAEGGWNTEEPHCFEGYEPDHPGWNKKSLYYPQTKMYQENPRSMCRTTMMRTLEAKLIYRPRGVNELYDLKKDPLELINVYNDPQYKTLQESMKSRMLDWYITTSDVIPFDKDPRNFPKRK